MGLRRSSIMRFILLVLCCFGLAVLDVDSAVASGNSSAQSVVVKKNNPLRSMEELLKNNNDNNDFDDLLSRIQNTQELLMRLVGKKKLTKVQLRNEIDKFNSNMREILEQYKKLVENKLINNRTSVESDNKRPLTKARGHAIVTLDSRKRLRFNPGHTALQDLVDPLLDPLTEENIQEFINADNKPELDNSLDRKDIPDSEASCHYVSSAQSAENSINDIEAQKELDR